MSKKYFQILVMIILAPLSFSIAFYVLEDSDSRGERIFKMLLVIAGAWLFHVFIYKPLEKRVCNDSVNKDTETNSSD